MPNPIAVVERIVASFDGDIARRIASDVPFLCRHSAIHTREDSRWLISRIGGAQALPILSLPTHRFAGTTPVLTDVDVNARDMPEDKRGRRSYETCGKEPVGRPTAPRHGS